MSYTEISNRIEYFNCCIGAFADYFKLSGQQAYRYLNNFKGLEFLYECYEGEHTQSIETTVQDMAAICKRNGGKLS